MIANLKETGGMVGLALCHFSAAFLASVATHAQSTSLRKEGWKQAYNSRLLFCNRRQVEVPSPFGRESSFSLASETDIRERF